MLLTFHHLGIVNQLRMMRLNIGEAAAHFLLHRRRASPETSRANTRAPSCHSSGDRE